MICANWTTKLDAYLDNELATPEIAELQQHMRECPECAAESVLRLQWKRSLRSAGQRYAADRVLKERIAKSLSHRSTRPWPFSWRTWQAITVAAMVTVAVVATLVLYQSQRHARTQEVVSELTDLHVATLASSTPVDVVSSDRHTVKPWFEGKTPFSFNLPDLNGSEYELVGGRVTYLEQAPGAELVFRLRKHQITAFIFQESVGNADFAESGTRGFHVESWKQNGLRYFLVGDVSHADLSTLRDLLQKAQ